MANRVKFSQLHPQLSQIVAHHQDLESSLEFYFSSSSIAYTQRRLERRGRLIFQTQTRCAWCAALIRM
jgi:hypothetical protein